MIQKLRNIAKLFALLLVQTSVQQPTLTEASPSPWNVGTYGTASSSYITDGTSSVT